MGKRWGRGACRLLVAVVFFRGLLLLCGCGAGVEPDPFAYGEGELSVRLEGSVTRLGTDGYGGSPALVGEGYTGVARPLAVTVTMGPPCPEGEREMTLTFEAPSPLAGMTVRRREGEVTLTLSTDEGPLTLPCPASLLRFGEVILPAGDVTAVSPRVEGRYTVTVTGASERVAVLTFSTEGGLPLAVRVETPREVLEFAVSPP